MVKFIATIEDKSYVFETTSVIKLMRYLQMSSPKDTFIITVEAAKDSDFISKFKVPENMRQYFDVIEEKSRKVVIKYDYNLDEDDDPEFKGYKFSVELLIKYIVIMCIFANDHDMIDKIDNTNVFFELQQDMVYDWNFEIIIGHGDKPDERVYSATVPVTINTEWFITMTIFRYITGRIMTVASPDCISLPGYSSPLLLK